MPTVREGLRQWEGRSQEVSKCFFLCFLFYFINDEMIIIIININKLGLLLYRYQLIAV